MSSVIRNMIYQPDLEELEIWFASGRRYIYFGVPEPVYLALRDAPSLGVFFNAHIRDRYAYRLVDAPENPVRRRQATRSAP